MSSRLFLLITFDITLSPVHMICNRLGHRRSWDFISSFPHIDLWCELGPDGVEVLRVPDGGEGARGAVLRGAEDELGPAEVVVHVVGQGHLRVRKGVEHLFVLRRIHRSCRTFLNSCLGNTGYPMSPNANVIR